MYGWISDNAHYYLQTPDTNKYKTTLYSTMGKLIDDFIKCEQCFEWIKNNTRSKLKHLNTAHRVKTDTKTVIGKFICSFCQKSYAAPNTLKRHQVHFHDISEPTPAPVLCVKNITRKSAPKYDCDKLKASDFVFKLKYAPQPYFSRSKTTTGNIYTKHTDWFKRHQLDTPKNHPRGQAGTDEKTGKAGACKKSPRNTTTTPRPNDP